MLLLSFAIAFVVASSIRAADERAKLRDPAEGGMLREEMQNMTDEERATRIAEMGIERPEGAQEGRTGNPGGRAGRFNALLDPLIELLTERAAA